MPPVWSFLGHSGDDDMFQMSVTTGTASKPPYLEQPSTDALILMSWDSAAIPLTLRDGFPCSEIIGRRYQVRSAGDR